MPWLVQAQERCLFNKEKVEVITPDNRLTAPDFTITTSTGTTLNLYNALNAGKCVLLDLFFCGCSYCQQYAPVIEQVYQNTGHGNGLILFWGISDRDNNAAINAYKTQYGVTNPCAGTEGGGAAATALYTGSPFNFQGWPTYSVICPNKTIHYDVNYPPTVTGFNIYFSNCGVSGLIEENRSGFTAVYPVPSNNNTYFDFYLTQPANCSLNLFDCTGRLVKVFEAGKLSQGQQSVELSFSGLTAGIYTIVLTLDNLQADTHKVLITQ